jgi:AbrB family looped-hinge helix DNA binding protein
MEATLNRKNQATIPKTVRDYLHLKAGDQFKFFLQPDGAVVILPKIKTSRPKGSVTENLVDFRPRQCQIYRPLATVSRGGLLCCSRVRADIHCFCHFALAKFCF